MVNAKKHKTLLKDEETRVKKIQTRYQNELLKQSQRRAFLYKHIGKPIAVQTKKIDKKRAVLETKLREDSLLC